MKAIKKTSGYNTDEIYTLIDKYTCTVLFQGSFKNCYTEYKDYELVCYPIIILTIDIDLFNQISEINEYYNSNIITRKEFQKCITSVMNSTSKYNTTVSIKAYFKNMNTATNKKFYEHINTDEVLDILNFEVCQIVTVYDIEYKDSSISVGIYNNKTDLIYFPNSGQKQIYSTPMDIYNMDNSEILFRLRDNQFKNITSN